MCSSWRWHWASADSWALEEALCLINGKYSEVSCQCVYVCNVCLSLSQLQLSESHKYTPKTKLKIFLDCLVCIYLKKNIFTVFIQQGCIKLIKGYRLLHCYKNNLFQINAVPLNFLFIKESWTTPPPPPPPPPKKKGITVSIKILHFLQH